MLLKMYIKTWRYFNKKFCVRNGRSIVIRFKYWTNLFSKKQQICEDNYMKNEFIAINSSIIDTLLLTLILLKI